MIHHCNPDLFFNRLILYSLLVHLSPIISFKIMTAGEKLSLSSRKQSQVNLLLDMFERTHEIGNLKELIIRRTDPSNFHIVRAGREGPTLAG